MDTEFDLDSLTNLEEKFYQDGYQDGYDHGRKHGYHEGKVLGSEKGYEMWEELAFYQGFATTWQTFLLQHGSNTDDRILSNIKRLLDLIQEFPKTNPTTNTDKSSDNELDVEKLFSRIRSRYRVLCSSLGIPPRLRTAAISDQNAHPTTTEDEESVVENAGESSGSSKPKPKVWSIMSQLDSSVTNQDLSY
ncbi:hypothetical protein Agabi119p4_1122 [Agaricus bisporus var. burnettii]|uniref:Essential protein Yae1 N-terminal domain-containing protein n=1 Tax=Agaricus bisporus var. burnettii TaxID=192524 RepID=A0A8H7FBV2_AGABI|nr:hypothetical protein Agabi119p4_1122 [Agaricus bisporus var. burnettii]